MKSKLQLLKDIVRVPSMKKLIFKTGGCYRLPPSLEKEQYHHLCDGKCWCVNKYNNRELKTATNIFVCSRLEKARMDYPGENMGITHHATVPLISGEESFGLLNVASPYREQFTQDELDLLESVAFQIGSTLKRIELTAQEQENMINGLNEAILKIKSKRRGEGDPPEHPGGDRLSKGD